MDITIKHNMLRLLGKHFMHLVPAKAGIIVKDGKYSIEHPVYGKLGHVVCVTVFTAMLYEIKPTVLLLSVGAVNGADILKEEYRLSNTDTIQCCVFQFLRRTNDSFKTLIDAELPSAGITIIRQSSLI